MNLISNISDLVKDSDLNAKTATLATKAKLKSRQDKIVKLQTYDLSYFLGNYGFQNMFVYQPTLDTLELKKRQGH